MGKKEYGPRTLEVQYSWIGPMLKELHIVYENDFSLVPNFFYIDVFL